MGRVHVLALARLHCGSARKTCAHRLFCSEGGASGEKALADVGAFRGKEPVATLIVKEQELNSGAWRQKVADFAKALK
jgi:hypothetical protein